MIRAIINQSKSRLSDSGSKAFNSLVELSWVLGDTVLHFVLNVECSDQNHFAGLDDAGTSVLLNTLRLTFLR